MPDLQRFVLGPSRSYLENSFTLAHASNAAYQSDPAQYASFDQFPFDRCKTFRVARTNVQGFVAASDTNIAVVFRGTVYTTLDNLRSDITANQRAGYGGLVHDGFATAFESAANQIDTLLDQLLTNEQNLYFAGHSLGGALATLAAWTAVDNNRNVTALYTFGCPRVGDPDFAQDYPVSSKRWVNDKDVVPQVPFEWFLGIRYKHVANPVLLKSNGDIETKVAVWEKLKDLFQTAVAADSEAKMAMFAAQGLSYHKLTEYIRKIEGNL